MMKFARVLAVSVVLLAVASVAGADTILLKNDVKLTGTIVRSDGKQLTLKTDYAGEIKVDWSAVQELTSDKPLYVVMPGNMTVFGNVTTEGTDLVVHPVSGPVTVPLANPTVIRSVDEQMAYDNSLHPGLLYDWKGAANLGFALARGNSQTTSFNLAFNADRKTLTDHAAAYMSSLYTNNNAPGGGVIADSILGGARYDRNIRPRLFGFGSADYTHDALQDLDLRSIYTGGLGWHAIADPDTTLDLLGGINYTRETYSTVPKLGMATHVTRNLVGLTLGDEFSHKFGASSTFTERFNFYPDLNDLHQYRFALDAAWATKIKAWLGWQVGLSDRYVTDPPIPGTKSNDFIFSTGLNFSFTH